MIISRNARLLVAVLGLAATAAAAATGVAPASMAALAALSLVDVLLGAVGIVVTAMTALAGLFVISDARMEIAGTRAWHNAAYGQTAAVSPAAEASTESRDQTASDPRAEMVRRILIAHRFDRPQAAPQPISPGEPRQEAHKLDAVRSMQDARSAASSIEVSVCVDEPQIDLARVVPDRALRLVASKVGGPTETAVHAKRLAKAKAATIRERRLVANGSPPHCWPQPHAIVVHELVATDGRRERSGPDQNQGSATVGTTTEQPACRGPPENSGKVARRKKYRPPTKVTDEMVVVDDLGERVPIGDAELRVIEVYLDHVLRDLLERHRGDKDPDTT